MLSHISADIISYVIAPYLSVANIVPALTWVPIKTAAVLARCQYKQPHGVVTTLGCVEHFRNGRLHREDGPAVVNSLGVTEWLINGKHHREQSAGPAVSITRRYTMLPYGFTMPDQFKSSELPDDTMWYQHGKLHKLDGYAVETHSRANYMWYINGKRYWSQRRYEEGVKKWMARMENKKQ